MEELAQVTKKDTPKIRGHIRQTYMTCIKCKRCREKNNKARTNQTTHREDGEEQKDAKGCQIQKEIRDQPRGDKK